MPILCVRPQAAEQVRILPPAGSHAGRVLPILGYSGGVRMANDEKQLLQIQQDITVIQARIKVLKSGGINENDRIEGLTDVIGELKAKRATRTFWQMQRPQSHNM